MYDFYILVWWAYIILLDSAFALKNGHFLILNRRLPYLIVLSAAFWCLFELLNLRLQNWFYVNLPQHAALRLMGYLLAYGTVIPAIYVTYSLLFGLLRPLRTKRLAFRGYSTYAVPLGLLCLVLALLFPVFFFCLAWVFLAFVLDGYNYREGKPSFAADLERGDSTRLVAAAASGLICGFLWEFWNYWSITKWIYTVPFFERGKLFEMPSLGYLGFAFFAVETIAFVEVARSWAARWRTSLVCSLCALVFALLSFSLIDRYTVFSRTPLVEDLSFLSPASRDLLLSRGVETSYAIDLGELDERERGEVALMDLKGLGLRHFLALRKQGVRSIEELSRLNEKSLSAIIGEPNLRRVRVYLRAARKVRSGRNPPYPE